MEIYSHVMLDPQRDAAANLERLLDISMERLGHREEFGHHGTNTAIHF